VAAYKGRSDADRVAKRLVSKGFSAYVQPAPDGASMFRVRVGPFKTRRDADGMAARLRKEERYKPWVTR
jgi:cell division septation protein DedD